MKQTVEEAAMQELNLSYAIIADGEFAYQQQAMLNMFKKGAEWALKEISEHVRINMSYSDKAWDVLSYIEAIKGNAIQSHFSLSQRTDERCHARQADD